MLYVFALGSVGYTLGAWAALQSALSNLEAVRVPVTYGCQALLYCPAPQQPACNEEAGIQLIFDGLRWEK